jgi:hypothetical protein
MVDTLIRFHCPRCNKRLKAGPELVGRRAKCTRCGQSVQVPEVPEPEPVTHREPPPLLVRPEPGAPREGEAWWDEIPILARKPETQAPEPWERFPTCPDRLETCPTGNPLVDLNLTANNGVQARSILAQVQKALPEAESAYKPSGRLPGAAVAFLLAGMGVGVVAAAVVRVALTVLGVLAVAFLGAVVANMSSQLFVMISAIVLVVGALAYFGFVYFAAGASAAWLVRLFGRLGKSRSPGVESLVSACSAGLAILLLWWASSVFIDESSEPNGLGADTQHVIATIEAMIGGFISVVSAAVVSAHLVRSAKFCEGCEAYMRRRTAKALPLADLYPATNFLKAGDLDGFRSAVAEAPAGGGGRVDVFTCPCCRGGFVELTARCEFYWVEGNNKKNLKKEWRTASTHLPPADLAAATGGE